MNSDSLSYSVELALLSLQIFCLALYVFEFCFLFFVFTRISTYQKWYAPITITAFQRSICSTTAIFIFPKTLCKTWYCFAQNIYMTHSLILKNFLIAWKHRSILWQNSSCIQSSLSVLFSFIEEEQIKYQLFHLGIQLKIYAYIFYSCLFH